MYSVSPYVAGYNVGGQYRFLEVLHQPRVLKDYRSGDQPPRESVPDGSGRGHYVHSTVRTLCASRRCDLNLGTFLLPDKRPGASGEANVAVNLSSKQRRTAYNASVGFSIGNDRRQHHQNL